MSGIGNMLIISIYKWRRKKKFKKFILHTHRGVKIKWEVVFVAKILIVEDNVDTNEALSEYLQDAGHVIISAYDGTEALAIFAQNKVDLIVLDIMLPTMSGLAVLNAVRRTSQVPVIMLTALEDEYTQVSSFDCLADDYITKPFSMVVLGKRITALLRRAGTKVEPNKSVIQSWDAGKSSE